MLDARIDALEDKALKLAKDVNSMVRKFQENVTDLKSLMEQFVKGKTRDVKKQQWASYKHHVEVRYNSLSGPIKQKQLTKGEDPTEAGVVPDEQFVVEFDNHLHGKKARLAEKMTQAVMNCNKS